MSHWELQQPLCSWSGHWPVPMTPFCFKCLVKALCAESQSPGDHFVDTYVVFHDAKAPGEAMDNSKEGDVFFSNNEDYIYGPRCQLLTCNNYVKGDSLPYTLDTMYRKY